MFEITIVGNICGEAYDKLISRLVQISESFLFHLPNMGKTLVNERNAELMEGYPLGYIEETDCEQHQAYIEKMQPFLNIIEKDIIEHHKDTGYLDQMSNLEIDVYSVTISENTKNFFAKSDNVFNWQYPNFPEDPCFLSSDDCIFQVIAHENLSFLYRDDPYIISLLDEYDIEYMM